MSTDLHDALNDLAGDVPALGDLESAIAGHRTRRRLRLLAAGAVLTAVALAVLLSADLGVRSAAPAPATDQRGRHHAAPATGLVLPPVLVMDRPTAVRLTTAPLPTGAAMAVALDNSIVVAINARESRLVTIERMVGSLALSPDGHYLSWSTSDYGGDWVSVVDVTTGRRLMHRKVTYGTGATGQSSVLHWAGDGRHLVEDSGPADGTGSDTLRVWRVDGGGLHRVGAPFRLPGRFVGVDVHARRFAAEDGDQVALASAGEGRWHRTGVPVTPPGHQPDPLIGMTNRDARGTDRWNGAGPVLAWLTPGTDATGKTGQPELRWLDLGRGTWATREMPAAMSFLGWRGTRPLLLRGSSDGAAEVVAVPARGTVRVLSRVRTPGLDLVGAAVARSALTAAPRAAG